MKTCPLCKIAFKGLRHHLKYNHLCLNKSELRLLLSFASERFRGRLDCTVIECPAKSIFRLDRHMKRMHPEIVFPKTYIQGAKRELVIQKLAELRAQSPIPAMVSSLDLELVVEDEIAPDFSLQMDEDESSSAIDVADEDEVRSAGVSATASTSSSAVAEMRSAGMSATASTSSSAVAELQAYRTFDPSVRGTACKACQEKERKIELLKREVAFYKTKAINVSKGTPPLPSKYSRSAKLTPSKMPKFERLLHEYKSHITGLNPDRRQRENAHQRVSHTRNFLVYMAAGSIPNIKLTFLDDCQRLREWVKHLTGSKLAVTTVKHYLLDASQFLEFLRGCPQPGVKLSDQAIKRLQFELKARRRDAGREITTHQQKICARKSKVIVSSQWQKKYMEKAVDQIPHLLDELEKNPEQTVLQHFFGFLAGFVVCITGHRTCVMQNMLVREVEEAEKDSSGHRLINVQMHKTNRIFGHAKVVLTAKEFSWMERFLKVRGSLPGGHSHLFFFNSNGGCLKKLLKLFIQTWSAAGLPGKPSFSMLRTSMSTHANRTLNQTQMAKVSRAMCHDISTAHKFYHAEATVDEAWKDRLLFEKALEEDRGETSLGAAIKKEED